MKSKQRIKNKNLKLLWSYIKLILKNKPMFYETPYNGILVKKKASLCKIRDGFPVVTIEGDTGRIFKFYGNMWSPGKPKWIDLKLDCREVKHVNLENVFVLFVYYPATNKHYPLSHVCYKYIKIKDLESVVEFRLTKRGYAMLSSQFVKEREYIAVLKKSRYGNSLLNKIEQLDYQIKKT